MREEDIARCQIQKWYPIFKSVSIKTVIHELPQSFIDYLLDNSSPFLLPISIMDDDALPNRIHKPEDEEDYQAHEGSEDESSDGDCSVMEIALLLKSSDSIIHDLCHAYDSCSSDRTILSRPQSFYLALRKWYPSLRPEMEFRCFVRNQLLVGVCQREVTTFYPALLEKKDELKLLILEFYVDNLRSKFESESYTFDIYVTTDGRVKLFDFNPWGVPTLPLLFTWEELEGELKEEEKDVVLDVRIIESQCGVRPGMKTAVPYDYLDTSPGSGWDQFLKKAEELQGSLANEAGA